MARIKLPSISSEVSRHGTTFYYFRRRGQAKIRLYGTPGSPEFMEAYHACLAGEPLPPRHVPTIRQIAPVTDRKSFRWLCQQYLNSRHFKALDVKTRKPRQSILSQICEMPISETNRKKIGEVPFDEMHSKAIRRIRDRKAETPEAANNWLKAIKSVFKWGIEEEHCTHNPSKDVPKIRVSTAGFHTWTIEEVSRFESAYPIGTTQRLALALLLYTGCRRADVVTFGPQHIKDGWLTYTQDKNQNTNPVTLSLPVLPVLAEIIAATPSGHLTFLISQYGKSYTVEGFGKNELMAIFGWKDIKQAERYTRMAGQKTLASDGMNKITATAKNKSNVSNFASHLAKSVGQKRK
jgi:integrase